MSDTELAKLGRYTDALRDSLENFVQAMLVELQTVECDTENYPNYLRVTYELWANSMGVMDGICSLQGVPQDLRLKSMRSAVQHGKRHVLAQHKERCSGCAGAEILESELDSVN